MLDEIRAPGRKLVWEIGAGWGGFAYQFKTLFPDVTYVIVDLPELFLFSATYLMTLFPEAKVSSRQRRRRRVDGLGRRRLRVRARPRERRRSRASAPT